MQVVDRKESKTILWSLKEVPGSCNGMYASVQPDRHTYGNIDIRLHTWTRVIVSIYV